MHPYKVQRLMRERHQDHILDLKRGSLYHAIDRLERAGLIEATETSREGRRPERTTYRITESGLDELLDWLRELLARPTRDSSEFIAAIDFLGHLPPDEVTSLLEGRLVLLEAEIAHDDSVLQHLLPTLERIFLLDIELSQARRICERDWTRKLVDDLRNGVITWSTEELIQKYGKEYD